MEQPTHEPGARILFSTRTGAAPKAKGFHAARWKPAATEYLFSAVVGTARCAVRAPFEGRNVCVTCTCGAIGSARSDAGGDIAARCPYPLNRYKPEACGAQIS